MSRALSDPTLLKDPWGQPWIYKPKGESYDLHSIGPDGQDGTADDVHP